MILISGQYPHAFSKTRSDIDVCKTTIELSYQFFQKRKLFI